MSSRKKTSNSEDVTLAGLGIALLGLAINAALKAQKEAKKNHVSYVIEEEGFLYRIFPSGKRKKIGEVKNPRYTIKNSEFNFE